RLQALERHAATVAERAPERLTAELARLRKNVAELAAGTHVDEQRLAVEVALLADRVDISEELVRFRTHLAACRDALRGDGADGCRILGVGDDPAGARGRGGRCRLPLCDAARVRAMGGGRRISGVGRIRRESVRDAEVRGRTGAARRAARAARYRSAGRAAGA